MTKEILRPDLMRERIVCRKALMELSKAQIVSLFIEVLEYHLPDKLVSISVNLVNKGLIT